LDAIAIESPSANSATVPDADESLVFLVDMDRSSLPVSGHIFITLNGILSKKIFIKD